MGLSSTEYPRSGGEVIKVKKVKLKNNFVDNPNVLGMVIEMINHFSPKHPASHEEFG
jgi:hypothetical protein